MTDAELERLYGEFYFESPLVELDETDVPTKLRDLIPYARFWGIADDDQREELIDKAPDAVKRGLKELIEHHDDELDDWLAGEQAFRDPSRAYVAFSAMRMAADFM